MRRQDQLANLADSAIAAVGFCRVVTIFTYRRYGVRNGNGVGDFAQQRQVWNVVTNESGFLDADAKLRNQRIERRSFVGAAENNVTDTEFVHSTFDGTRLSTADDGNFDSCLDQLTNAEAVLGTKGFGFDAIVGKMKAAVGEDAVDIERDKTQGGESIYWRFGSHMMPARKRS